MTISDEMRKEFKEACEKDFKNTFTSTVGDFISSKDISIETKEWAVEMINGIIRQAKRTK